jgi:hypothetical protein
VLDYNTSLIDVADDVSGVSPDVTLGSVYASAGGWSLVTNVDDASGHIVMVFWRSNGVPMPSGSGPIANIAAHVSNTAIHNQSIPVQVSGPMSDQGLTFSHQDGNILVDAVPPPSCSTRTTTRPRRTRSASSSARTSPPASRLLT